MPDVFGLCDECRAIRDELVEAYFTEWAAADQATRDAWNAVRSMIGGTEADVERAEELVSRSKFRDHLKIRTALKKAFEHRARTGHPLPLRPPL